MQPPATLPQGIKFQFVLHENFWEIDSLYLYLEFVFVQFQWDLFSPPFTPAVKYFWPIFWQKLCQCLHRTLGYPAELWLGPAEKSSIRSCNALQKTFGRPAATQILLTETELGWWSPSTSLHHRQISYPWIKSLCHRNVLSTFWSTNMFHFNSSRNWNTSKHD